MGASQRQSDLHWLDIILLLIYRCSFGIHHFAVDSTEALLAYDPAPNTLSLVYRSEPGQMQYVYGVNRIVGMIVYIVWRAERKKYVSFHCV